MDGSSFFRFNVQFKHFVKTVMGGVVLACSVVLLAGCAGGASDSYDSGSDAEGLSLSIRTTASGRSVAAYATASRSAVPSARTAMGSSSMYQVTVSLSKGGYSDSETAVIPIGSNTASITFDDVPVGSVTAVATIFNRYHKKWTCTKQVTIVEGDNVIAMPMTEVGFDISGMQTGDIVLSTGGYVTRADYNYSIDSGAGSPYAGLRIGSSLYAIDQGTNQYSSVPYETCVSSASSRGGISWASEGAFRMPTKDELQAIYGQRNSWMGTYSSDGATFGLTTTFSYWSSTKVDDNMPTRYWVLDWYNGIWTNMIGTSTGAGDEYICRLN